MSARKCAVCDHDPACGFASIWNAQDGERWLCHADDHSCYTTAPAEREWEMTASVQMTGGRWLEWGAEAKDRGV